MSAAAGTGRFAGKTVLISGGASGIGAATARRIVSEGGCVALGDRAVDAARRLADELGGDTLPLALEVTDEASWKAAFTATGERFGKIDGLLNSAGVGVLGPAAELPLDEWRRVYRINATGTFLGCQGAIRAMKAAGGGSIVNISSVLGLRGSAGPAAYCASKGAVRLLTKNVALHCARMKYGIRCNSVHPGYIDTPMVAPRLAGTVDGVSGRAYLESIHPMGRLGRAEEIAAMIAFLLSDDSSFATGAEFTVDGGLTA